MNLNSLCWNALLANRAGQFQAYRSEFFEQWDCGDRWQASANLILHRINVSRACILISQHLFMHSDVYFACTYKIKIEVKDVCWLNVIHCSSELTLVTWQIEWTEQSIHKLMHIDEFCFLFNSILVFFFLLRTNGIADARQMFHLSLEKMFNYWLIVVNM